MTVEVVVSGSPAEDQQQALAVLRDEGLAERLAARDADLWGPDAAAEASIRLGWLDVASVSSRLLPELLALRDELRAEGVDRVVLCGMGGSSLAPEVICRQAGVPLTVLDSTHPDQVRAALSTDLSRTVVVVSSKSGGTVETDSHRRAFVAAGLDPARRLVVVTDPGSPLEQLARAEGCRAVFLADPHVGGRYSALTAFGLVPSALAGADVEALLAEARPVLEGIGSDVSPGLLLGAALGSGQRDKLALDTSGSALEGFGDWAEQLVAESTGKEGTGLLPVVVEGDAPEVRWPADDVHVVRFSPPAPDDGTLVTGPLGAQLVVWEHAIAVAGHLLGINPFDQPDVESAKQAARALLDSTPSPEPALFVDGAVEVRGSLRLATATVEGAVDALLSAVPSDGYLAVMAYLDRHRDEALAAVRGPLARRIERPVTFGWGPRFLHSTGQLHKGGPPYGVFLQVTGLVDEDLPVPDRPFTFGTLIAAQAAGDARVLEEHGSPVLRLHLTGPDGVQQVLKALS